MKLLVILIPLLFVAAPFVSSEVEWPFSIIEFNLIVFNISGGTPSQHFPVATFHLGFYHPLAVDRNIFDPTVSSSWVGMGNSTDQNGTVNGVMGTDTLVITDKLTIPTSSPFEVVDQGWLFPGLGVFTLARSSDGTVAFSEKLLADQKSKLITLAYDQWSDNTQSVGLTGSFIIGGKGGKKCATKWTRFNETTYMDRPREQWTVNLAKIKVGKYSFSKPGQASFQINDPGIGMPAASYDSVVKALGSMDGGATIPCDTTTKIVFTLDHKFDITIKSDHYLVKQDDGTCTAQINRLDKATNGFILPIYVLRDYCLLLDYDNKQVGLASRTFK